MNIKKIGLSALAGSLAMVSANAVELAVSGKTEITYVSNDTKVTGNPFGMGNAISFDGSGDVNGMTASYYANINDGGVANFQSSALTLDMGDLGKIAFDQGVAGYGVGTIDDKMPYAYEEITNNVTAGNGLRAAGGSNVIGYAVPIGGVSLSLEYDPGHGAATTTSADAATTGNGTTDSGYNFALTGSPSDGWNVGYGYGNETQTTTTQDTDKAQFQTLFATYAIGAATIGYQKSEGTGGSTGSTSENVDLYGISFSVNENLAISYNMIDNEHGLASATHVTEETVGVGASYTMGSAAFRFLKNETDNVSGVSNVKEETMEISLLLAF